MTLTIREATEGDFEALCTVVSEVDELHRRALPHRFVASEGPARPFEYFADAIRADDVGLFVAEIAGQVVGLVRVIVQDVAAIPILVPRRYAVVENLVVLRAHRRHGVGRALLERAEGWARAKGAASIELNVYAFNQDACTFYAELGFRNLSHYLSKSLAAPDA